MPLKKVKSFRVGIKGYENREYTSWLRFIETFIQHQRHVTTRTATLRSTIKRFVNIVIIVLCITNIFRHKYELKKPREQVNGVIDRFAHRAWNTLHLGPEIRSEDGRIYTKHQNALTTEFAAQ